MRHRKHKSRLSRSGRPRKELLRGLVEALLENEKVKTTETRARVLRSQAEKMITLARDGSQAARRRAFAFLHHKDTVHKLFEEIGPRFADRDGGYLRIVKMGPRPGDGAPMALVEMVDREIKVVDADEVDRKKSMRQRLADARRAQAR